MIGERGESELQLTQEQEEHLINAYLALDSGKHPTDLYDMLDYIEENAVDETIQEFVRDARYEIGTDITEIKLSKDEVDFSSEATVVFLLGVQWERHEIFTGGDLV